jgi:anti-anti-sigma regulatory factor
LERQLQQFFGDHADAIGAKRHVLDLQCLPALSSRQLGTMLTLRKALEQYGGLWLTHVSESARQLLALTRMDRFYNIIEER